MTLATLARFLTLVILVATASLTPRTAFAFPGDLDRSFGANGVVVDTSLGGGRALALQADRRIVVVHEDGRLSRFLPDGTRDASFGTDGVVTLPVPGYAVAVQPDGELLVAGGADGTFALARFDPNGTPDPTFGSGGVATLALGTRGYATAILRQSTGAVIIAGAASTPMHARKTTFARFTTAGGLDGSFGDGGMVILPDEASWERVALRPYAGDDFVALTDSGGATVMRFDANGALDPTFASGGTFWRGDMDGVDVAVQPDGRIVYTGYIDLGIATGRLTTAGTVDTTFGNGGTVANPPGFSFGYQTVVEPSGDVVVGGAIIRDDNTPQVHSVLGVFRYTSSGVPDGDFGAAGITETDLGGDQGINAIVRDGDTLVVAGERGPNGFNDPTHLVLARYELGPLCRVRTACTTAAPGHAMLERREVADPDKDRWRWTFSHGGATALAELGDPPTTERYALCLFDETGLPAAGVPIAPGATCNTSPCWRPVAGKGFRYHGRPEATAGIASVAIKAGPAGRSSVTVDARGSALPPALLAQSVPFSVQLQSARGACFASSFSSAGIRRDDGSRLKVAAD